MTISQNLIDRNNNGEFPKQKSIEWYKIRQNIITASETSSILDCNIYQTAYELLIKKLSPIEYTINEAMEWGNIFEPIAIEFYEYIYKETVHSLGLIQHPKYNWIGASPDGILIKGRLLEIKCPFRRSICGKIPLYYWIQMQIQMEVCDIDECDYFECKFYRYSSKEEYDDDIESNGIKNQLINNDNLIYYKLTDSFLKTVTRDKDWFQNNIIKLKAFYDKILYYRTMDNGLEQLRVDSRQLQKRKKTYSINLSSKRICNDGFINWNNWVSATRIRNYMLDDPLIDWLDLYYTKFNKSINNMTFQQCVMKQGIKFEEKIISDLKKKYPKDIVTVANFQEAKSYDKYLKTITLMKKGVPIIHQGVLHDYDYKIFGMPDLLVRYDWINKIFESPVINSTKKSNKKSNQYRVIEIKFISLELCADGKHLRNSNKNILAYKGQIYIYNKILGKIQVRTPSKSYIIGKRWSFQKCQEYFSGSSFERCAHVNFKGNDKFIRYKTALAIKWIRELNTYGSKWDIYSRNELKPNMCNIDQRWDGVKKQIADKYNEITSLWMCGIKNREIAERNGVTNWRTHKGLTAEKLGVFGSKNAPTLQLIIDMNQCSSIREYEEERKIEPNKIRNNLYNWKKTNDVIEFYVDFETISNDICECDCTSSFIFMIGVGINLDGNWNFKCFIAERLNNTGERNMLIDFHKYITNFAGTHRIWHWGSAENYLYRNAMNRHNDILKKYTYLTEWCDMLRIFKEEPIVAYGMINFSLKSVVKAFYDNEFIETSYDNCDIDNGLNAMILAYETYKTNKQTSKIMKDIEKYNEVDCKVLMEIISYLRNNHI